jgi:hypothetical protein
MKRICWAILLVAGNFFILTAGSQAQTQSSGQPQDSTAAGKAALTMAEYEKAKTFSPADLDKDSYVKFENAYIIDRNDFGKPYFITGDDGLKKRIDLYKLIRKEGRT